MQKTVMGNFYQTVLVSFYTALAAVVVLNGIHLKDLAQSTVPSFFNDVKKQVADDQLAGKVSPDLHNHVDKQTVKPLSHLSGENSNVDSRSLRLLQHQKNKVNHYLDRLNDRLRNWLHLDAVFSR